ncbi:MAG TPA: hypothetical protein VLX32_08285 [Candidatus Acidoferrum sp.]|nr:hypothetical protein [Candidatus Acidoferrum sp.]
MADQPPVDRFKPDMPEIPGLVAHNRKSAPRNMTPVLVVGGLAALVLVLFLAGRWLFRSKPADTPVVQATPQIEVPPPAPDPAASLPHVSESAPEVAAVAAMAKPWSSQQFFFRSPVTGANIPAILIRLPDSSASQPSGYWALQLKAAFGDCQLEYVADLKKLKSDYDYRGARHPMVGNPCTRSLFDPLRMSNLPGNVWVRGAMVQGSDLRPPLGIEIQIKDDRILAVRME